MKLLIGNTGLIGTTLKDSITFDHEFNSSNIDELTNMKLPASTDIFLSCLPATKWKVNQDPDADLKNILNIIKILASHSYRNIVLYSTIDVYADMPDCSNEDTKLVVSKLSYGTNRYLFELLVQSNINYEKLIVLRLPALFGKHIKKNIIYDLLNNNQINKIQMKSQYQWYNLNRLVDDTHRYLASPNQYSCINLFPEPIATEKIISMFPHIKKVDITTDGQYYNFQTKHTDSGYMMHSTDVLNEIQEFVKEYSFLKQNIRIAICLFGEQRNLLDHTPYWKHLQTKFNADIFTAMYVTDNMQQTLRTLNSSLKIKKYDIVFNDLDHFDSTKHSAKTPIYIYKTDPKATIPRLMSQFYIRQRAMQLVDPNEYDVVLLCRTDISSLNLSTKDIMDVANDKKLIKASYERHHTHPGGGGGCMHCTIEQRCESEFHANDICDHWCIGSSEAMKTWRNIYDNAINFYGDIQKTSIALTDDRMHGIHVAEQHAENEIHITFPVHRLSMIENDVHCFYPEKIMRVAFKDCKVCHSNDGVFL